MSEAAEEVAPPEVHHYSDVGEVPWDIQKYGTNQIYH
jgi:trimethylguanosine synthase